MQTEPYLVNINYMARLRAQWRLIVLSNNCRSMIYELHKRKYRLNSIQYGKYGRLQ